MSECARCRGTGEERVVAGHDIDDPCRACGGSGSRRHSSVRETTLERLNREHREREQQRAEAIDQIEWYVRNLRDVIARRPVRGLDEAQAGYERAIDLLKHLDSIDRSM